MIKIILFGLLLVLTCQLKLNDHLQGNPLNGKTFAITSNALEVGQLNGVEVAFNDGSFFFKGCNICNAQYRLGPNGSFSAGRWITTRIVWLSSTRHLCKNDSDELLQSLFDSSVQYDFKGDQLNLYNQAHEVLLTLHAH